MKRSWLSQVFLFVLMLVIGFLIVAQIRTHNRTRALTSNSEEQVILLSELVIANQNLRSEVSSLRVQLEAYEADSGASILENLVSEMNRIKVTNGLILVSGPGIELLVDGPLTALNVYDILNELRNAGAEAISFNEQRIVISSVIEIGAAKQLIVDGQLVSRPYVFQVIGDPDTIETAILRKGGVVSLLQRTYPNLVLHTSPHARLVLPVYRVPMQFEYAVAIE